MSRIISGIAGGLRLANVPGSNTRPTTDRVKEALFSRLESYDVLKGSRVLDLFGGSGSLGCEALSRGASHADLVDHYEKAAKTCETNLAAVLKATGASGRVNRQSAASFLSHYRAEPWDLVFIDPPYDYDNEMLTSLLELLIAHLAPGAVVVVERSARTPEPALPAGIEKFSEKKYGETVLYYLEPEVLDEDSELADEKINT